MRSSIQEKENRVTTLAQALRLSGWTEHKNLAARLLRCQQTRTDRRRGVQPQWPWQCRSPACSFCRRRLVRRGCARAAEHMVHAHNSNCYMATIMLARCAELADVHEVIREFRAELRNLRDRRARTDGRWQAVEAVGQIEIEALGAQDICLPPPQRRAVVEALPVRGGAYGYRVFDERVAWLGHVHLAVHAPGLTDDELGAVLKRQWPGPKGRVDVQRFYEGGAGDNTEAIIGYATKHDMQIQLRDGFQVTWPIAVQAEYWGWLHGLKRGLATLRIRLGPKRAAKALRGPDAADRDGPAARGEDGDVTAATLGTATACMHGASMSTSADERSLA